MNCVQKLRNEIANIVFKIDFKLANHVNCINIFFQNTEKVNFEKKKIFHSNFFDATDFYMIVKRYFLKISFSIF